MSVYDTLTTLHLTAVNFYDFKYASSPEQSRSTGPCVAQRSPPPNSQNISGSGKMHPERNIIKVKFVQFVHLNCVIDLDLKIIFRNLSVARWGKQDRKVTGQPKS